MSGGVGEQGGWRRRGWATPVKRLGRGPSSNTSTRLPSGIAANRATILGVPVPANSVARPLAPKCSPSHAHLVAT